MSPLLPLISHPATPAPARLRLQANVIPAADGSLHLIFDVTGISAVKLPPPALAEAADGLWQHTCCEAFIAGSGCADYREFNFSPSGRWAAYRFHGYRDRDTAWQPTAAPHVDTRLLAEEDRWQLSATVPAVLLPATPVIDIALTTVIECLDGAKSYWALAHATDNPDFHCRNSFTLNLNRP